MAQVPRVHRRTRLRSIATALAAASFILAGTTSVVAAADLPPLDPPPPLAAIDPQIVTQSVDQDWTDYQPIPGSPYVDSSIVPSVLRWKVALILTDFPGTPFAITQPEGSTIFGNPGPLAHDIPRDAVPAFYVDWMNNPQAINQFQGMNRYWMEDTYGKYGVDLSGYGPYLLPRTQDEYFITDFTSNTYCNTQTRTTTAQTGVSNVEVVSSASFSVGKVVSIAGLSGTRVVTAIPDATHLTVGPSTTMAAASIAGATVVKYANVTGLAVGQTLNIGFDDRLETRTIVAVGASGSGGAGITVDSPLAFAHAQNTLLRDMTATPINVNANAFIHTCNGQYRTDTVVAWTDHVSQAERSSFNNTFYVSAGQDESGTWQEFGEMMFTQTTVPDEWGPPNPEIPQNWAGTRYIPWTSWRSAASNWPNASGNNSIEGEGSGMAVYAHELTHNLGISDNYNNPYASPFQRAATGYWSMMSRGSFQGPGGTHTRWHIPSTMGTALGSQHVIRDKIKLGFVSPANFLDLNRNGLAASGLAVLDVTAREVNPGTTGQTGVRILLDGPSPIDHNTSCTVSVAAGNALTCSGPANFTNYTMEVVQQVGSDSFQADQGVLIEKNKVSEGSSCGTFSCFAWVIDAHPEDINLVDFVRPDGTTQMVTTGDPRQLTDAPFHAGQNSGSSYEWEDTANGLHFYVIDRHLSADGVLSYTLAVRNINGSGPQVRGVSVANTPDQSVVKRWATCDFPLTNTGAAAAIPGTPHPEDASAYLNNDVYRLSASVTGSGWQAQLANALTTAAFGQTVQVPVYVTRDVDSAATASVSLTATSESDPTKTSTATCALTVPATRLWVGLKNSDDQGTKFDIKVELFRNTETSPVAAGLARCVTGITRNPTLAKLDSMRWDAYDDSGLQPGDAVSVVVSARIGTNADGTRCTGPGGSHASAVGLRLYYDAVSQPSGFDATAGYTSSALWFDSDGAVCKNAESTGVTNRFLNVTAPDATAAKCKDSGAVKFAGGNPWSAIGRWTLP